MTEPITGSGSVGNGWLDLATAVVFYDHPQEVAVDHALCLDFRPGPPADPSAHVAVELDPASARRLALAILSTLDGAGV